MSVLRVFVLSLILFASLLNTAQAEEPVVWDKSLSEWIKIIDQKDHRKRNQAFRALSLLGPKAFPAFQNVLRIAKDPKDPMRGAAMGSIGTMGEKAKSAVPFLLSELKEKNRYRYTAIDALAKIGSPGLPDIHRAFKKANDNRKVFILSALERFRDSKELTPIFQLAFKSSNNKVIVAALRACQTKYKACRPILSTFEALMLADPKRAGDCLKILRSAQPHSVEILLRLLKNDSNGFVQRGVLEALRSPAVRGRGITVAVAKVFRASKDRRTQEKCLETLGALRENPALVLALALDAMENPQLVRSACSTIISFKSKAKVTIAKLETLVDQKKLTVEQAVSVFAAIGEDAIPALERLYGKDKGADYQVIRALSNSPRLRSLSIFYKGLQNPRSESSAEKGLKALGIEAQDVIVKASRHSDPRVRKKALSLARALKGDGAEVMAHLLADKDPSIRRDARSALFTCGKKASKALPVLSRQLKTNDKRELFEICRCIKQNSKALPGILPALLKRLDDPDHSVRLTIVSVVGFFVYDNQSARNTIIKLIGSDREAMRQEALSLSRNISPPTEALLQALTRGMKDSKQRIRELSAQASLYHAKNSRELKSALISGLRDKSPSVRGYSFAALARVGKPVYGALFKFLRLKENRRLVAGAFYREQQELLALSAALLSHSDRDLALFGLDVITNNRKELRPSLVPALCKFIVDTTVEFQQRQRALWYIGALGTKGKAALPTLRSLLNGPDKNIQSAVLRALASLGEAGASLSDEVFQVFRKAEDRRLLGGSVQALRGLGEAAAKHSEALVKIAMDQSESAERREKALVVIASIGEKANAHCHSLIALLDHPKLQRSAAGALARMGSKAVPAAEKIIALVEKNKDNARYNAPISLIGSLAKYKPELCQYLVNWATRTENSRTKQSSSKALEKACQETEKAYPYLIKFMETLDERSLTYLCRGILVLKGDRSIFHGVLLKSLSNPKTPWRSVNSIAETLATLNCRDPLFFQCLIKRIEAAQKQEHRGTHELGPVAILARIGCDSASRSTLLKIKRDRDQPIKLRVFAAISLFHSPDAEADIQSFLEKSLENPDIGIAAQICSSMGACKERGLLFLLKALDSRRQETRAQAMAVLSSMRAAATPALPKMNAVLAAESSWSEIRKFKQYIAVIEEAVKNRKQ